MEADPQRIQTYGVSQEIPFPSKLSTRREISSIEAKRAREEYRIIFLSVITQLKKTYY